MILSKMLLFESSKAHCGQHEISPWPAAVVLEHLCVVSNGTLLADFV